MLISKNYMATKELIDPSLSSDAGDTRGEHTVGLGLGGGSRLLSDGGGAGGGGSQVWREGRRKEGTHMYVHSQVCR